MSLSARSSDASASRNRPARDRNRDPFGETIARPVPLIVTAPSRCDDANTTVAPLLTRTFNPGTVEAASAVNVTVPRITVSFWPVRSNEAPGAGDSHGGTDELATFHNSAPCIVVSPEK